MILTVHQPVFLPWPGFFCKAMRADRMVLLDDVQFPRGKSWLNRNRLKNEQGQLWLTVPVWKTGRGLQRIREVEIFYERPWREKHLRSLRQNYVHAPYFSEFYTGLEIVYARDYARLAELNVELIKLLWGALSLETDLVLQSSLGIESAGTDLLIELCERMGADRLAILPVAEKHIDVEAMKKHGVTLLHVNFQPPVYPQLWGEHIYNLSTLDMLLNCGPKSREIIAASAKP
jgi:hypothetical protein